MDVRPRPDARDDAELVRAATAGDRNAFAAIYDRYADRLHDFCWGLLRDRDEAADATQDAFLVAAERLGQVVWDAAGGLSPRDRALLDLHLRHGLEGAELGQAMNIEPGHVYVLLSR